MFFSFQKVLIDVDRAHAMLEAKDLVGAATWISWLGLLASFRHFFSLLSSWPGESKCSSDDDSYQMTAPTFALEEPNGSSVAYYLIPILQCSNSSQQVTGRNLTVQMLKVSQQVQAFTSSFKTKIYFELVSSALLMYKKSMCTTGLRLWLCGAFVRFRKILSHPGYLMQYKPFWTNSWISDFWSHHSYYSSIIIFNLFSSMPSTFPITCSYDFYVGKNVLLEIRICLLILHVASPVFIRMV